MKNRKQGNLSESVQMVGSNLSRKNLNIKIEVGLPEFKFPLLKRISTFLILHS